MRKLLLTLTAALALLSFGFLANRADAFTFAPAGVRGAIGDITLTDQVHCRPGVWHHLHRPHDGCGGDVIILHGDRDRDRDRGRDRDRDRDRDHDRDRDRR
jgi:hypothetical protein